MITLELELEVKLSVDKVNDSWASALWNNSFNRQIGEIQGKIDYHDNGLVFVIDTSDIEVKYRNKGIGTKFYEETIKQSFKYCLEMRSCDTRNDLSERVWKKLMNKYYNVSKLKRYYRVSLPDKQIIY